MNQRIKRIRYIDNKQSSKTPSFSTLAIGITGNLAITHPKLAEEWSDKNCCSVEQYTKKSLYIAYWDCRRCGNAYQWPVYAREFGDNVCCYCNSIGVLFPDLAKEYSPNNEFSCYEVPKWFPLNLLWICPACHGEYRYKISDREVGDHVCPYCNNEKTLKGINDLKTTNPELAKEYSINNKKRADEITESCKDVANWICPVCHGEYSYMVSAREVGDHVCPYCNNKKLLKGFNDLATTHPELAKRWSQRNAKKPSEVIFGKNSFFINCPVCSYSYMYHSSPNSKISKECPCCSEKVFKPGYNDLQTKNPELAKEFSSNNKKTANNTPYYSKSIWNWICPTCNGEYKERIKNRSVGDKSCPYCNKGYVLSGLNDLLTMKPLLAKEWSEKNLSIPNKVHYHSPFDARWKCLECGNTYIVPVRKKEVGNKQCPNCNNIAKINPILALEYSPNNTLKANEISIYDDKKANWICPVCHGEYSYKISDREVGDHVCPYCNNKKALKGFNDLETTDPELAREYSENNKKRVDEIVKLSKYTVNWICPVCHGEYSYMVYARKVGDHVCPYCNNKKALPGYNTIDTSTFFEGQWMEQENSLIDIDKNTLTKFTNKKIWLKCKKCNSPYFTCISDYTELKERGLDTCPRCKELYHNTPHYF